LLPHLIPTEIAGKTYQKCRNTRGKCFLCRSGIAGFRRDWRLSHVFSLERLRDRSFSVLKFLGKCSHLIHIDSLSALPAGWRLEIRAEIDKKKTEIYFSSHKKKS